MTTNIYVSPHLDDAVFSCGALISRQVRDGQEVLIVTVMAGDPPTGQLSELANELHRGWGLGGGTPSHRREEDLRSCLLLGAKACHLRWPDAIYRLGLPGEPLYPTAEALFGPVQEPDLAASAVIADDLLHAISSAQAVYCPLGIGRHVDHRLARMATERLRLPLRYYFDLPYALRAAELPVDLGKPKGERIAITLEEDEVAIWGEAVAEYTSQYFAYWSDRDMWRRKVSKFLEREGGFPVIHALGSDINASLV